jgi:hypothetical protein
MRFEWDEAKNKANREKHGISFEEAVVVFDGIVFTRVDDREGYGEVREISIGEIGNFVVVVVVHTDRGNVTRIISARLADDRERKRYYDHLAEEIGGTGGRSRRRH